MPYFAGYSLLRSLTREVKIMGVGLISLTIYATDLEKTKQFYEAIGFELHKIQGGWSINYYYFAKLENDLNLNIGLSEPDKIIKENRFKRRFFLLTELGAVFENDIETHFLVFPQDLNIQFIPDIAIGKHVFQCFFFRYFFAVCRDYDIVFFDAGFVRGASR